MFSECLLKTTVPQEKPLSATDKRLLECREETWKIYQQCKNGHQAMVIGHCFIRYCDYCYESKLSRNKQRIMEYRNFFGRTCKHFILTVPYGKYDKKVKEELEDDKRKFFQILRRSGLILRAIAVFDYGNPKSSDAMETNVHIHVAANMRFINFDSIRDAWQRATGRDDAVIKICTNKTKDGKETTNISTGAVLRYFARRMSGEFGHGKDLVFFKTMGMTTEQYDIYVRGSRVFTWNRDQCQACKKIRQLHKAGKSHFTKCISCKKRAKESQKCPICDEILEVMAVSYGGAFLFARMDWVPPNNLHEMEDGGLYRQEDDYERYPRLPISKP